MDSARKRKAINDQPAAGTLKKIRLLNSNSASTPGQSDVQKVGFKLLDQLDRATDKHNRLIAGEFKALPDRELLPDYYEFTKLPVAIKTIREKLEKDIYPTVTTLESDLKRMVQNAKDYNQAGSDIYDDAERIRKLVYNYMKVNNPEYAKNPGYVSFPTPLPDVTDKPNGVIPATNGTKKRRLTEASVPDPVSAAPETAQESIEDDEFVGKTFQEAQEQLIGGMLQHTDDNGLEIYTPFAMLPSRKLEDYYKLIKYPVSLKGVMKRIRGIHGRNDPTGITDYKTWDAFENEVSWIWRNAQDYNEDASDMYILAEEFKLDFLERLKRAKSQVDEPEKLKLKLNASKPKVTLNLGQHRASPGVTVDNEALARQRQMVSSGMAADARGSPAINGARIGSAALDGRPQSSHTGSDHGQIKLEKSYTESPAPTLPNGVSTHVTNGNLPSSYTYTAPAALPPAPVRIYSRDEALLPSVTIATHPQLKLDAPYSLVVEPHRTLSQESYTVSLPSTHYYLQISPMISKHLSMGRPYKMFVIVNGARLTQQNTILHQETGRRTHTYEGTLTPGVNRIEVEVAAAKFNQTKGLDIEKIAVYVNLMKP